MFPIRDHNPTGRLPFVTYALMLANIGIFISTWHLATQPQAQLAFYAQYALVPIFLSEGHGYTGLITSIFLHGGLAHLAGNMLFLFIFGDNLEDRMGHFGFALFYLICGIGAGLAQYAAEPFSNIPTIGASGAIAGVMGGYLLLFPRARVDIFLFLIIIIRIIPVPAWIVLMLWFAMQVIGGFGAAANEGGIAYWAHAGGFVIGMIAIIPTWTRLGGVRFWRHTHGHPPHAPARYRGVTRVPRIPRR